MAKELADKGIDRLANWCAVQKFLFFSWRIFKVRGAPKPKEVVIEATVAYKPVDLCI